MTFEDWMVHRGPSRAAAQKYAGAIRGVMSDWAIAHGILDGPLTALKSRSQFEPIATQIRALPIFQRRDSRGNGMYGAALNHFANYLSDRYNSDVEIDIDRILEDTSLDETEKITLVKSRIGQGVFRQRLVAYWKGCAVTGYKDIDLLIASHIKPWCVSSNEERLSRFNGLLLLPNLNYVFDTGLISFSSGGTILISQQLGEPEKLGIAQTMRVRLRREHLPFMAFHHEEVYRDRNRVQQG